MRREGYYQGGKLITMLWLHGLDTPTLPIYGELMIVLLPRVMRNGTASEFVHAEIRKTMLKNIDGKRLWHCIMSTEVPGSALTLNDGEIVVDPDSKPAEETKKGVTANDNS